MPMDRGDSVVYADRIRIDIGFKITFLSHLKICADSAFLQGLYILHILIHYHMIKYRQQSKITELLLLRIVFIYPPERISENYYFCIFYIIRYCRHYKFYFYLNLCLFDLYTI